MKETRKYINLAVNNLTINDNYTFPLLDGSYGQLLVTDGVGNITWKSITDLTFSTDDITEGLSNLYFTNERVDDRTAALIQNGTGISWLYNDIAGTLTPTISLASFSTSNLSEGTNLYFTNERVDDRAAALIQNGTGISWLYNDIAGTLTPTISLSPFTSDNLTEGSTNKYVTTANIYDIVKNIIKNGTGLTWTQNAILKTLTGNISIASFNTDNLTEGSTNLYFTNERVDDRVATLIQDSATITWAYNDALGTLTATAANSPIQVQKSGILTSTRNIINFIPGSSISLTIADDGVNSRANITVAVSNLNAFDTDDLLEGSGNLYFTNERVDDRVALLIQNGTGISWTYNDLANTLTPAITLSPFDTDDLSEGSINLYFTNERVDDRVATLIQDSESIIWTYDDSAGTLTADITGTITVQEDGNFVSNQSILNFIAGSNIILEVDDDPGNNRTNVTISRNVTGNPEGTLYDIRWDDILIGGDAEVLNFSDKFTLTEYPSNQINVDISLRMSDLIDVTLFSPIDAGDILMYNSFGHWENISMSQIIDEVRYQTVGIITTSIPNFIDNGNGTINVESTTVALRSTSDNSTPALPYNVPAITNLAVPEDIESYLIVNYNNGYPVYQIETDIHAINSSNNFLVYVLWYFNEEIHSVDQDILGLGTTNKINQMELLTQRYRIAEGHSLTLSETSSPNPRTITISGAHVYAGISHIDVLAFNSSIHYFTKLVKNALGGWDKSRTELVYDNEHYNPFAGGLSVIPAGKWIYIHYYRSIGDIAETFWVISDNYYDTITEARSASIIERSDIPDVLRGHCLLVGRSLIQYGANNGVTEAFIRSSGYYTQSLPDHNQTINIQGGQFNEYYHLNSFYYNLINLFTIEGSPERLHYDGNEIAFISDIESNNELSEVLLNGNTTGGTDILFGTDKAYFGSSYIYDNGSNLILYSGHSGQTILDIGNIYTNIFGADGNYLIENGNNVTTYYGYNGQEIIQSNSTIHDFRAPNNSSMITFTVADSNVSQAEYRGYYANILIDSESTLTRYYGVDGNEFALIDASTNNTTILSHDYSNNITNIGIKWDEEDRFFTLNQTRGKSLIKVIDDSAYYYGRGGVYTLISESADRDTNIYAKDRSGLYIGGDEDDVLLGLDGFAQLYFSEINGNKFIGILPLSIGSNIDSIYVKESITGNFVEATLTQLFESSLDRQDALNSLTGSITSPLLEGYVLTIDQFGDAVWEPAVETFTYEGHNLGTEVSSPHCHIYKTSTRTDNSSTHSTTSEYVTYGNNELIPYHATDDLSVIKLKISCAGAAVAGATVGTNPTLRFALYTVQLSGRTLLGTFDVPMSSTSDIGIYSNSSPGVNLITGEYDIPVGSIVINEGEMFGIEFQCRYSTENEIAEVNKLNISIKTIKV